MFYVDYRECVIHEISEEDVINQFADATTSPRGVMPRYFFEDGAIWRWSAFGHREHVEDISKSDAHKKLLGWAINDAVDQYSILIHPTKKDALQEIQDFIDDMGGWDLDDERDVEARNRYIELLKRESGN